MTKQNSQNEGNDFLPTDYEVPKTSDGYMKWKDGDNKFRILSKPILGWLDWKDKKPMRFPMNEKPPAPINPQQPVKHFWAMVVWNYSEKKIQVLEITQKSVLEAIKGYANHEDWGSPYEYDITVKRTGQDMNTEYMVTPSPHKKVVNEVIAAFNEKPINLLQLWSGDDPFATTDYRTPLAIPH